MSKPYLSITEDFTEEFNKIIQGFKHDNVLVGIPSDEGQREGGSDQIGNAALLAINNFGSPAQNIPARPVMSIGIRKAQDEIGEQFRLAASKVWTEGVEALNKYYERAGIIASNSIKKVINAQDGIKPLAPATLAARRSAKFSGTKALIVTGQMRNAITYVVQRKGL